MKFLPSPETREAVLKHPFVLAGLAVVLLLGLTAGVLVLIDSARGDTADGPSVEVEPKTTATQGPVAKTAIAGGFVGRTNTTAAVRFRPGSNTAVLGTLPKDTEVQVDGRTTDALWLRIIFPRNSELHGWVDAEFLDISEDAEALAVVSEEPDIDVDVPTQPPVTFTPDEATATSTPEGTPTPEPGLPDLVVGTTPTISDGKLFVTVVNQGTGTVKGDLVVAIFNADGTALLAGATLPGFTLEPGRSIDVGTGYSVTESQTLLLVVDPNGDIEETDNTNNRVTVAISIGDEEPPVEPEPSVAPTGPGATPTFAPPRIRIRG